MLRNSVLLCVLLLGGCASTVYKNEATELGTTATALANVFPTEPSIISAGNVLDVNADMLMAGGPVKYHTDCGDAEFQSYFAFIGTLGKPVTVQDASFAALKKGEACGLMISDPAAAPDDSSAVKNKSAGAKGSSAAELAADMRLRQDEARQAAAVNLGRTENQTPPTAICNGSCSLESYTDQIKAYGAAIQAAAAAQSVTDAQKAAGDADTALKALITAAGGSPLAAAITDAVTAIGKLALQQAQYAAMKHAVLEFDYKWPEIAPAVETAARFRQAQLIRYRANSSQNAALSAQLYVNDPSKYHSMSERLALFTYFQSRVENAASAFKAAEIDPGSAIAAFTKANHSLALAMEDPHRQLVTLQSDLAAVKDQISAIEKAAAPVTTPSKTAK